MGKKEYLKKILAEGHSVDEIAALFGITPENLEKYTADPEKAKLAVAHIKTELTKLDAFPLEDAESLLLFAFKVVLESINFLFGDIEEDLSGETPDRASHMVKHLIDGAYLLLAIAKLEKAGENFPRLRSDSRFMRACQNKNVVAARLLDIAERIEQNLNG